MRSSASSLADLPWQGSTVKIYVQTRRFFCPAAACPRRIFTERLPETAAYYARRTLRLSSALDAISLALGGEARARLAGRLSMEVSPDTLLRRLIAESPAAPAAAPRVLGVDDWAYRKGQSYGTMLVDLEARRPVDLLLWPHHRSACRVALRAPRHRGRRTRPLEPSTRGRSESLLHMCGKVWVVGTSCTTSGLDFTKSAGEPKNRVLYIRRQPCIRGHRQPARAVDDREVPFAPATVRSRLYDCWRS